MDDTIKRWMRPVVYPPLHAWQWFHDHSRSKLREYEARWRDYREKSAIRRDGTIIVRDIHGIRFVMYPFDRPNLLTLVRRPNDVAEFQAIPSLVRSGNVALDVGANLGLYSVLLSRLCGREGRVWAFEPVPETYWRLRETLALNRCGNVTAVQEAVYESKGVVQVNVFEPEFSEWNTLGKPVMQASDGSRHLPKTAIDVPSVTLDQFCEREGIERINFLKVDVEGFEMSVFVGAERLLREHRVDHICFEISQDPLKAAGLESRRVFEALELHGYHVYHFEKRSGRFKGPIHDTSELWANFFASWRDLSHTSGAPNDNASHRSDDRVGSMPVKAG